MHIIIHIMQLNMQIILYFYVNLNSIKDLLCNVNIICIVFIDIIYHKCSCQ